MTTTYERWKQDMKTKEETTDLTVKCIKAIEEYNNKKHHNHIRQIKMCLIYGFVGFILWIAMFSEIEYILPFNGFWAGAATAIGSVIILFGVISLLKYDMVKYDYNF